MSNVMSSGTSVNPRQNRRRRASGNAEHADLAPPMAAPRRRPPRSRRSTANSPVPPARRASATTGSVTTGPVRSARWPSARCDAPGRRWQAARPPSSSAVAAGTGGGAVEPSPSPSSSPPLQAGDGERDGEGEHGHARPAWRRIGSLIGGIPPLQSTLATFGAPWNPSRPARPGRQRPHRRVVQRGPRPASAAPGRRCHDSSRSAPARSPTPSACTSPTTRRRRPGDARRQGPGRRRDEPGRRRA